MREPRAPVQYFYYICDEFVLSSPEVRRDFVQSSRLPRQIKLTGRASHTTVRTGAALFLSKSIFTGY